MSEERFSSFERFSRSFSRCREVISMRLGSSSPASRMSSPRETPSSSSTSSSAEIHHPFGGHIVPIRNKPPLLRADEQRLISLSLDRALDQVDFGNEIVIRLLNDKRSLFKSLLARCAPQAHEIVVFDVQSLADFCPRAVQVSNGVTRFFRKVSELLHEDPSSDELEARLTEMCRSNGAMHYRMRVWFQAENWLCVKHSVVDTVLMANSNLKRGKQLRSAGDLFGALPQHMRCLNLSEKVEIGRSERQHVEVAWMKLMQFVIGEMKHGFLTAALSGKEEQDEEL